MRFDPMLSSDKCEWKKNAVPRAAGSLSLRAVAVVAAACNRLLAAAAAVGEASGAILLPQACRRLRELRCASSEALELQQAAATGDIFAKRERESSSSAVVVVESAFNALSCLSTGKKSLSFTHFFLVSFSRSTTL